MPRKASFSRILLSTKPQRRSVFLQLLSLSVEDGKQAFESLSHTPVFRLSLAAPLGGLVVHFSARSVGVVSNSFWPTLFGVVWVSDQATARVFFRGLPRKLFGVCFGWGLSFFVEGYHFRLSHARIRQLSQAVVLGRLGFFRNLFFLFPSHVRFSWRKRSFFIRGTYYSEFRGICQYLRMVRNLFPYKLKGLVYDNYLLNRTVYEQELFALKPGKKDKQQR